MPETTVLLCRCATHGCLNPSDVCKLQQALEQNEAVDLRIVDDLCGTVEGLKDGRSAVDETDHVIACFPRAVRWLLNRDRAEGTNEVEIHNLREQSAEEILLRLKLPQPDECEVNPDLEATKANPDWPPWFPVIDYDRCTDCGQCLSFCLFNVFDKTDDGQVMVAAPRNCKDNCPACARICPEVAIMFPKTDAAPINGDEIQDELLEREKALIALQQSAGSNLHAFLHARNRRADKGLLKPEARKTITGDDQ